MSDPKKGTEKQQSQQTADSRVPPKPVKVRVEIPIQVRPDKIVDYHLVIPGGSGLTESFVIAVIGEKGILPEQFTFHRPIGFTDLEAGDWVCTPTSDVHYLESAREDPREAQLALAETKCLLELACEGATPILKKDGSLHRYVDVPGQPARENVLSEAESKLKAAIAVHLEAHNEAQKGKTTKAKHKHDFRRENFLDKEVLAAEEELKKLRRDKRETIRARVPRTYRTLGGPLHDRPQVRVPWITQKASGLEARRVVYTRFATMVFKETDPLAPSFRDVAGQAELEDLRRKLKGAEAQNADLLEQIRVVRAQLAESEKNLRAARHDQGLLNADLADHKRLLAHLETVVDSVLSDTAETVKDEGLTPVDAFAQVVRVVARLEPPEQGEDPGNSSSDSTPATGEGDGAPKPGTPVARSAVDKLKSAVGLGSKPPRPKKG